MSVFGFYNMVLDASLIIVTIIFLSILLHKMFDKLNKPQFCYLCRKEIDIEINKGKNAY